MTTDSGVVLDVHALSTRYRSRDGLFRRASETTVLDNLNLIVRGGETLGLVGESGSGKTTLILSVLRLLDPVGGEVLLDGQDLLRAKGDRLRRLRREVQVVFQNPFSSLDPHLTVLQLIAEPIEVHERISRAERRRQVERLLADVGMSSRYLSAYPHELSGGQAQRIALARALALRPRLLLLDEPTSSLDVSVQAQVLNLLVDLQGEYGLTYLFVSHDLTVVQHISDRIAVMYLGEIVELGDTESVFRAPQHPYTQALLAATAPRDAPNVIARGGIPSFERIPTGCRFHTRCPFVMEVCRSVVPPRFETADDRWAACHLLDPALRAAGSGGRKG